MPDLFLYDKSLGSLAEYELKVFLQECDAENLKYIRIDENSWQLLPSLLNFTLLLKPLSSHPAVDLILQSLKTLLYRQGANVILDRSRDKRSNMQDILDAQLFVSMNESSITSCHSSIHLYYSKQAKEKSIALIGGFMKNFDKNTPHLSYNIASYWKHLASFKYHEIINSKIPSVIMEIRNPSALTDSFQCIVNNMYDCFICLYGNKINLSEVDRLKKCWEKAKNQPKGLTSKKNLNSEKSSPIGKIPIKLHSSSAARQTHTKPGPISALGRKRKSKDKPNFLSPSAVVPINYFVRPSNPVVQPPNYKSQIQSGIEKPIPRSTFRKFNPLIEKQIQSKGQGALEQKTTTDTKSTFIQSLKSLDQMLHDE